MSVGSTMLLGVIGSRVGGFISWIFSGGPSEPFHAAGWIMSIVGAILVVWIGGFATRSGPRQI
jgi:uncharacterized membrane protein YeaQ/YmgE (transglycosylase-associated protein family)